MEALPNPPHKCLQILHNLITTLKDQIKCALELTKPINQLRVSVFVA